jgi:hypothetical protein
LETTKFILKNIYQNLDMMMGMDEEAKLMEGGPKEEKKEE